MDRAWRRVRRHPGITAAVIVLVAVVVVSSAMIRSLNDQNYRLQGYRSVMVTTKPPGARVAFIPIDSRTGEPDPDPAKIIRPQGTTPLRFLVKPERYLVEAVVGTGGFC